MTDASALTVLDRCLRRETASLLEYIGRASARAGRRQGELDRLFQSFLAENRILMERLGEMVLARGGIPGRGEFPVSFTSLNFLTAGRVLAMLRDAIDEAAAALGRDRDQAAGDAEALSIIDRLVESKRWQAEQIRAYLAAAPASSKG